MRALKLVLFGLLSFACFGPEFKRLVAWLHGGTLPAEPIALKMQQSVKTL